MKKEIENNEWIESFLKGDLSPEEMQDFRNHLETDPLLARELEQHKLLHRIINDGTYLHIKGELGAIHYRKSRRLRRIKRASGFGIAGLIVFLIVILIFRNFSDDRKSSRESLPPIARHDIENEMFRDQNNGTVPADLKGKTHGISPRETAKISESEYPLTLIQAPEETADKVAAERDSLLMDNKPVAKTGGNLTDSTYANPAPAGRQSLPESGTTAKTDCRKVKIQAQFSAQESCNSKPTGSFVIERKSLTGGLPPYAFSINRERFYDTTVFYSLYPGNYPVYVKDGSNCIVLLGTVRIGSVDCTYQAAFAPLKGETWTVPVNHSSEGILQIFSKAGTLVYTRKFNPDETPVWGGEIITGQLLPMGIYQFEIRYTDGSRFTGNVTIVK